MNIQDYRLFKQASALIPLAKPMMTPMAPMAPMMPMAPMYPMPPMGSSLAPSPLGKINPSIPTDPMSAAIFNGLPDYNKDQFYYKMQRAAEKARRKRTISPEMYRKLRKWFARYRRSV